MGIHGTPGSGIIGMAGRVTSGPTPRPPRLVLNGAGLPVVGTARIYVCGITPYDVTHLGHAATFVWADLLAAVVHLTGVDTSTCRNVTDVDDVLTRAADQSGKPYDQFALTQEFLFDQNMRQLQIKNPDHSPRARHHIAAVQQLGQAMLDSGAGYEHDGQVYFRAGDVLVDTGLGLTEALELSSQHGDEPDDPHKEHPLDVPVWRSSDEHEPAWPSPWGWGRPGWHAECAAMSLAIHGASVDVLVGGHDLAFPHHAYQSAMVESVAHVTPFARRQMHVGTVHRDGHKMAKSTGNLVLVDEVLAEHSAAVVRLHLLDRPWAASWEYDAGALTATSKRLDALHAAAGVGNGGVEATAAVVHRLLADLDVHGALEVALSEGGEAARWLTSFLHLV